MPRDAPEITAECAPPPFALRTFPAAGRPPPSSPRAELAGLQVERDARRPTAWDGASSAPAELSWWDFPGLVERWWRNGRDPKESEEPAGIR